MSTYQYITRKLTDDQFRAMVHGGIISPKLALYKQIYEYHEATGRCRVRTSKEFGLPSSTIGYAIQQMKREM